MSSTENSEREKNLVVNYVGTHPYSFSSSQRVHKYYPGLSQNNIHKKLSKVDVYSLFRKKKRSKANPIYVYYPRQLFQVTAKLYLLIKILFIFFRQILFTLLTLNLNESIKVLNIYWSS